MVMVWHRCDASFRNLPRDEHPLTANGDRKLVLCEDMDSGKLRKNFFVRPVEAHLLGGSLGLSLQMLYTVENRHARRTCVLSPGICVHVKLIGPSGR